MKLLQLRGGADDVIDKLICSGLYRNVNRPLLLGY